MGSIFVFLSPNLLREMNWETSCMVYIGELSMVFIGVDRIFIGKLVNLDCYGLQSRWYKL